MNRRFFNVAVFAITTVFGYTACSKGSDKSDNLNQADQNFVTMAAYSNMDEIDEGQLAIGKASDASVKAFGQQMVTAHTTAEEELRNTAMQNGIGLPGGPDSNHLQMKGQLSGMTGRMFDSAYIHGQVTDHQNAINLFQTEINSGSNTDIKNYAIKYLPKIQMHQQMADSLVSVLHF